MERALKIVDGVMLLVDASEGPLPQTRYVLMKALEAELPQIVVINKIDRPDARIQEVLNEIYDLFIDLDANENQLDFPVLYTIGKAGIAKINSEVESNDLGRCLKRSSAAFRLPRATRTHVLQPLVANLEYSDYLGRLAIGRAVQWNAAGMERDRHCQAVRFAAENPRHRALLLRGLEAGGRDDRQTGRVVAIAGVEEVTMSKTMASAGNSDADAEDPDR